MRIGSRAWWGAAALGAMLGLGVRPAGAQGAAPIPRPPADKTAVLERYRGTWDVTIRTRQPKLAAVTSTETWDWTLDRRFLRGDTGIRSDGSQDNVIAGYDPTTRGFPFWIFSSTGAVIFLAPGVWNPTTQTLEWKNEAGANIQYLIRCTFVERNQRQCTALAKDWKGKVLLDQETVAVRRER